MAVPDRAAVLICLLTPVALLAAPEMKSGFFRGNLESVDGTANSGQIIARDAEGSSSTCAYDSRSYIELDKARVVATKLRPGDRLEIVADRRRGSSACYARMVLVVPPAPPPRRTTAVKPAAEAARRVEFARGDRTYAGLVIRHDDTHLTIRMRSGEEQTLLLRPDTRYLDDGIRAAAGNIANNLRVSVRAGRNLDGDLEAYQVVWGETIDPR